MKTTDRLDQLRALATREAEEGETVLHREVARSLRRFLTKAGRAHTALVEDLTKGRYITGVDLRSSNLGEVAKSEVYVQAAAELLEGEGGSAGLVDRARAWRTATQEQALVDIRSAGSMARGFGGPLSAFHLEARADMLHDLGATLDFG